jgi:uncharacterized membrane protein YidH (DUF202 family)
MGLDIRLPLGLVFVILGAIMAVYGALTWGSQMYAMSGGMNINLIWGAIMLLFGAVMLVMARRSKA